MKNKHGKFLLSLLFSLSLVFSACNTGGGGGGQPSNKPTPTPSPTPSPKPPVAKFKVTFNATDTSCKKGAQGGDVFTSGSEIEEGETLKFTAIMADGESLVNWYVNDNKKESETQQDFVYKVVAEDADSNKVINISYASNVLKLKFDSTITCKKGYSGSGDEVASGVKVKEGEDYQFTPLITQDEIVDAWYAGKRRINFSPSRDPEGYTVKKSDGDEKNIIKITYKKREIKKYTIDFDSNAVSCKKGYSGTGEAVDPGTEIKEAESYKFTAVLGTGEKVKYWLINGKPRTYETGTTFSYTVRKTDVAENVQTITISFEKQ